jgi:hypothetical protein
MTILLMYDTLQASHISVTHSRTTLVLRIEDLAIPTPPNPLHRKVWYHEQMEAAELLILASSSHHRPERVPNRCIIPIGKSGERRRCS